MSRENNSQETLRIPGHDDPAERRRILNIQAQRRYRQRKKSRLRELESLAQLSVQQQPGTLSGTEHGQSITFSYNQDFINVQSAPELTGATDFPNSNSPSDILAEPAIQELESLGYPGADEFSFPADGGESLQGVSSSTDSETLMLEFENQNSRFIPPASFNDPPDLGASSSSAPDLESQADAAFSDYLITVPCLSCIRAHIEIFKVMHGPDFKLEIWNPQALSPFALPERNTDQAASKPSHYPQEFHTTAL